LICNNASNNSTLEESSSLPLVITHKERCKIQDQYLCKEESSSQRYTRHLHVAGLLLLLPHLRLLQRAILRHRRCPPPLPPPHWSQIRTRATSRRRFNRQNEHSDSRLRPKFLIRITNSFEIWRPLVRRFLVIFLIVATIPAY